jgi:hypothetical protein
MNKLIIILFLSLLFLNFKPETRTTIKKGICLINYESKNRYEYFKCKKLEYKKGVAIYQRYRGLKIEELYFLIKEEHWNNFKNGKQTDAILYSGNYEPGEIYKCIYVVKMRLIYDQIEIIGINLSQTPYIRKDYMQYENPTVYADYADIVSFVIIGVELWK